MIKIIFDFILSCKKKGLLLQFKFTCIFYSHDVNLAQIFYWPEHIEYVTDRAFGLLINKVFFLQLIHLTCRLCIKYTISNTSFSQIHYLLNSFIE